jgi:hypothetical protein
MVVGCFEPAFDMWTHVLHLFLNSVVGRSWLSRCNERSKLHDQKSVRFVQQTGSWTESRLGICMALPEEPLIGGLACRSFICGTIAEI